MTLSSGDKPTTKKLEDPNQPAVDQSKPTTAPLKSQRRATSEKPAIDVTSEAKQAVESPSTAVDPAKAKQPVTEAIPAAKQENAHPTLEQGKPIVPASTKVKSQRRAPPAHLTADGKPKIAVIIDDEPANRDFLERLIQQARYETMGAASGKEAKKLLGDLTYAPSILVIDSELPDMKGMDLLKFFRPQYPQAKIIMATMLDDRSLIHQAFENGCDVFLVKPHGFMELFKRLQLLEKDETVLDQLVFDIHGVRARRK